MPCIVKVLTAADGKVCKHTDRWVTRWNAHTPFGTCAIVTTDVRSEAKRFESVEEAMRQWRTVSRREPTRPNDGQPNRPLTALTIEIEHEV